jgi:hypothetical protein
MSGRGPTGFEPDADDTRSYSSSKKYTDSSYPSSKAEPGKKAGDTRRYKGGKGLHKRIRAAIAGGPKELLKALNELSRNRPETATAPDAHATAAHSTGLPGSADDQGLSELIGRVLREHNFFRDDDGLTSTDQRLDESINRVLGGYLQELKEPAKDLFRDDDELTLMATNCLLWSARKIIDSMIQEGDPRSKAVVWIILEEIHWLKDRAIDFSKAPSYLSLHFDMAAAFLLALWAASDAFLGRVRRCHYVKCRTPYFLDRAPAGHARFCSPSHRARSHKAK